VAGMSRPGPTRRVNNRRTRPSELRPSYRGDGPVRRRSSKRPDILWGPRGSYILVSGSHGALGVQAHYASRAKGLIDDVRNWRGRALGPPVRLRHGGCHAAHFMKYLILTVTLLGLSVNLLGCALSTGSPTEDPVGQLDDASQASKQGANLFENALP